MTSVRESFAAYRTDGRPIEVVVRHYWDPEGPWLRERREEFCVRHGLTVPTYSCAASCIMAAFQKE